MNERLKTALRDLNDELKRIGPENARLIALREKTVKAIEAEEHDSLLDELKDVAEEFEVRHPELTAMINHAMNALSGLGI